jgi:hypothetical protein
MPDAPDHPLADYTDAESRGFVAGYRLAIEDLLNGEFASGLRAAADKRLAALERQHWSLPPRRRGRHAA